MTGLSPIMVKGDSLLRVGDRSEKSLLPYASTYPNLLPDESNLAKLRRLIHFSNCQYAYGMQSSTKGMCPANDG